MIEHTVPLEIWFLGVGVLFTIALGVVLIPIVRKAMKDDQNPRS